MDAWTAFQQSLDDFPMPAAVKAFFGSEIEIRPHRARVLEALSRGEAAGSELLPIIQRELLPRLEQARSEISAGQPANRLAARLSPQLQLFLDIRQQSWEALKLAIEQRNRELAALSGQLAEHSELLLVELRSLVPSPTTENRVAAFQAALVSFTPKVWVTPAIVGINSCILLAMALATGEWLTPPLPAMVAWGANFGPRTMGGEWWRLLTSAFLHFGVIHLAFNMWVLWDVGRLVERLVGNLGFMVLYVSSALFGSLASLYWRNDVVSAGASGAVFGVVGALLGLLLRRHDSIPGDVLSSMRNSVLLFCGYNFLFGLRPGIDMACHVGGFLAGFACGMILSQPLGFAMIGQRWKRNVICGFTTISLVSASIGLLPDAPEDLQQLLQRIAATEQGVLQEYALTMERLGRGEVTEADLAKIVDNSLQPRWRQARRDLEVASRSRAANQELLTKIHDSFLARDQAWSLLVESIQAGNRQQYLEFERKWAEADRIAQSLSTP